MDTAAGLLPTLFTGVVTAEHASDSVKNKVGTY
jgi:hypothetical protein